MSSKEKVNEILRLQRERSIIIDSYQSVKPSDKNFSDKYESIKSDDKQNWKDLLLAREELFEEVYQVFGVNLFELKRLAGL